jgi:hypothetical protein
MNRARPLALAAAAASLMTLAGGVAANAVPGSGVKGEPQPELKPFKIGASTGPGQCRARAERRNRRGVPGRDEQPSRRVKGMSAEARRTRLHERGYPYPSPGDIRHHRGTRALGQPRRRPAGNNH